MLGESPVVLLGASVNSLAHLGLEYNLPFGPHLLCVSFCLPTRSHMTLCVCVCVCVCVCMHAYTGLMFGRFYALSQDRQLGGN